MKLGLTAAAIAVSGLIWVPLPHIGAAHAQLVTEEERAKLEFADAIRRYVRTNLESASKLKARGDCNMALSTLRYASLLTDADEEVEVPKEIRDRHPNTRVVFRVDEVIPEVERSRWESEIQSKIDEVCLTGEPAADAQTGVTSARQLDSLSRNAEFEFKRAMDAENYDRAKQFLDRLGELSIMAYQAKEALEESGQTGSDEYRHLTDLDNKLVGIFSNSSIRLQAALPAEEEPAEDTPETPGSDDGDEDGGFAPPDDTGRSSDEVGARVEQADGTGGFRLGGPLVKDKIWFFASVGRSRVAQTGSGFRRDGPLGSAPEEFAAITPREIDYLGGGIGGRFGDFSLSLSYYEGDETGDFSVEEGPDSGVVYGDLSPSGSSGIATPFGIQGSMGVDYSSFSARAQFDFASLGKGSNVGRLGGFLEYKRIDRTYTSFVDSSFSSGGFDFNFSQSRVQDIEDNIFSAGLSDEFRINADSAVQPYIGGYAGVSYRDSSLSSVEVNLNNFTGPPDDNFTLTFEEKEDSVSFIAGGEIGVDFRITDNSYLGLSGRVDYYGDTGAVFNLNSGDQSFLDGQTTSLRSESVTEYAVRAQYILDF